jgi:hypothetical protein
VGENFFELGGHSLLATQVTSRLRDAFKVNLPLRALFEAPTVAQLAERVAVQMRDGQGEQLMPIRPAQRSANLPLSFAQQRLWFMEQLEPGQAVYNIVGAVRLSGDLKVEVMEKCLNEVVRRHESLRTTFAAVEGQPVQVIAPSLNLPLHVIDLRHVSSDELEAELSTRFGEKGRQPFDLEAGPLLRVALFRLGDEEYVMQLTMHHIISDGWSLGVFVREVGALYEAFVEGRASTLAELPIQYADFALWQRQWMSGETLEKHLDYWRRQLAGIAHLELPTDFPRPVVQTFRGGHVTFVVTEELTDAVRALSRRHDVTLFMSLMAAFQTLLHRYARQDDVVIGADIANRNRAETEALIGFFVNMLVMRADFSGDPTFAAMLRQAREVSLEAFAHQDVPFDRLVDELQPERSSSYNPLFQVAFVLQNAPMPWLKAPGLDITPYPVEHEAVQFDLILALTEEGGILDGSITYNADLFEAATMERMAGHYLTLLRSVSDDPGQPVSALRFLTEEETEGLTPSDFPDAELSQEDFENLVMELSQLPGEL